MSTNKNTILLQKITNTITPLSNDNCINAFKDAKNNDKSGDSWIDLMLFLNDEKKQQLKEFINNGNVKQFSFRLTTTDLTKYNTLKELDGLVKSMNLEIDNTIDKKDLLEYKKVIKNAVENKEKQTVEVFNNLRNKSHDLSVEHGANFLYLNFFYLNGVVADKKILAPLISIPIKLTILNQNEIILTKYDVIFNSRLFLYLQKNIGGVWNTKPDKVLDANQLVKFIKDNFNNQDVKIDSSLMDLKTEFKQFDFENISVDFKVTPNVAIQMVEVSGGSVKSDIEYIINQGEDELANIFPPTNFEFSKYKVQSKWLNSDKESIITIQRPLNLKQKFAVISALTENTIIFGPAGTGKSETIATIIGNIIGKKQENVLMVSEKKAALEVIENRIGELAHLVLPCFESDNLEKFYKKIINFLTEFLVDENIEHENIFSSSSLGFYKKQLDEIQQVINSFDDNTQTTINDAIKSFNKIDYQNFITFSKMNLQNEIVRIINEIRKNDASGKLIERTPKKEELAKVLFDKVYNFSDIKSCLEKLEKIKEFSTKQQYEKFSFALNNENGSFERLMRYLKDRFEVNILDCEKQIYSFILSTNINTEENLKKARVQFLGWQENIELVYSCLKDIQDIIVNKFPSTRLLFLLDKIREYPKKEVENYLFVEYWIQQLGYNSIEALNQLDINVISKQYYDTLNDETKNNEDNTNKIFSNYLATKRNEGKEKPPEFKRRLSEMLGRCKKDNLMPINSFIKEFFEELLWIFPIWIMNPKQVSAVCPIKKDLFDNGIFDEASQMFLEVGYPILYRTKNKIVAGDDKQMQPTAYFLTKLNLDPQELQQDLNNDNVLSLLDKAKVSGWNSFNLANHYRSDLDNNIKFTNDYIYDGKLTVVSKNIPTDTVDIEVINNHYTINQNNLNNEMELVDMIRKIFEIYKPFDNDNKFNKDSSIMLVCLNNKRSTFVKEKLRDFDFLNRISDKNFSFTKKTKPIEKEKLTIKETNELEKYLQDLVIDIPKTKHNDVYNEKLKEIKEIILTNINNKKNVKDYDKFYFEIEQSESLKKLLTIAIGIKVNWKEIEPVDFNNELYTKTDIENVIKLFENNTICVKNLDDIQGSEANVVMISMGFAKGENGKLTQSFGKLDKADGKNALNVLITRAKQKTFIFKSFTLRDLDLPKPEQKDKLVFYRYIEFIEKTHQKNIDKQKSNVVENKENNDVENQNENTNIQKEFVDSKNKMIYNNIKYLCEKSENKELFNKLEFYEDYKLSDQFKIDFSIYDKENKKFILLILKNNTLIKKKNTNTMLNMIEFNDKVKYLKDRGYNVFQLVDFMFDMNMVEDLYKMWILILNHFKLINVANPNDD